MQSEFNLRGVSVFEVPLPLNPAVKQSYGHCLPELLRDVAQSRQQDFIAGRYCAIQAAKKIGLTIHDLPSAKTREPLWPEGITGSISHSKEMAISCISRSEDYFSLGIDAEEVMRPELARELAGIIASEKEIGLLNHMDLSLAVTILFSAKEAFYKAIFPLVRSFVDFKDVLIKEINLEHRNFELELLSSNASLIKFQGIYSGSFKIVNQTVVTLVSIQKDEYVYP